MMGQFIDFAGNQIGTNKHTFSSLKMHWQDIVLLCYVTDIAIEPAESNQYSTSSQNFDFFHAGKLIYRLELLINNNYHIVGAKINKPDERFNYPRWITLERCDNITQIIKFFKKFKQMLIEI